MSKVTRYMLIVMVLVVILLIIANTQIDDDLHVYFLDVGQGDAILIRYRGINILIDGGPNKKVLSGLGAAMPFYDRKIDLVLVTHSDADHLTGVIEVLNRYQVERVMWGGYQEHELYREFLSKLNGVEIVTPQNTKILIDDFKLSVLWPDRDDLKTEEPNDLSLLVRLDLAGQAIALLTGDISSETERYLLVDEKYIKADILKVAHHGSKNSSADDFLGAVSARYGIISVGENKYGHPTTEALERLNNKNVQILRTDEQGIIIFDCKKHDQGINCQYE